MLGIVQSSLALSIRRDAYRFGGFLSSAYLYFLEWFCAFNAHADSDENEDLFVSLPWLMRCNLSTMTETLSGEIKLIIILCFGAMRREFFASESYTGTTGTSDWRRHILCVRF